MQAFTPPPPAAASTAAHAQPRSTCAPHDPPKRPRLILAPMEVLADRQFRGALSYVGGLDEAVHEFIRIPDRADLRSIRGTLRRYDPHELRPVPLAAQLMGAHVPAVAAAAALLAQMGAPRVDLNCGCPSRRVTGRGAGSSLLKDPRWVFEVARAVVDGVGGVDGVAVSVKMRSGFEDVALLEENVLAAVEAGVDMVTLHPRTKVQGYDGEADWGLIARVKRLVGDRVQVVGNGDVNSAEDAIRLLDATGCDHVMVGRGAVRNPWVFWEIRKALEERYGVDEMVCGEVPRSFETEKEFYSRYFNAGGGVSDQSSTKIHKMKIGRLKMLVGFSTSISEEDKHKLHRSSGDGDARCYLQEVFDAVSRHHSTRGCIV